jgi:hypothetical protein
VIGVVGPVGEAGGVVAPVPWESALPAPEAAPAPLVGAAGGGGVIGVVGPVGEAGGVVAPVA